MSKTKHKKYHKSRIIAKIEIKSKNCVKPIQFEGLKKSWRSSNFSKKI